ncbi:glycosyltransferase family 4 protein [Psychroflexus tropicus]|uniref:glycosyltransferase family 4 protein n=1 Tax=Psychroflexus tropicus TaxID=197345 RepID=UPI00037D5E2C|nr:glycosyltransferase family 4 protein [Psychroflexus tropicus]
MHKLFVHHRSPHHSTYSGYAQLLAYVEGKVIDGKDSKLPYKLSKYFSGRKSNKAGNYDSNSVQKELELFTSLKKTSRDKCLVHYLNAERDIRYNLKFKKNYPNTRFLATFHKPPSVLKERITETKYLRKLDAAICVGQNQVEFIKDWLGIDQVAYIPHGVDTGFFKPDPKVEKEHCILFVGQHLRDFELLNWVLPKFLAYDKSLKIKVVGIPFALKKIKEVENVVKLSKVGDEELKHLYLTSKGLFLPLVDGTACNSILEAMACGLPIVTNAVGGNNAYLEGTHSCFENDKKVLFQEVINLLENKTQREIKSILLRQRALDFDWKKIAIKIEKFHNKLNGSET